MFCSVELTLSLNEKSSKCGVFRYFPPELGAIGVFAGFAELRLPAGRERHINRVRLHESPRAIVNESLGFSPPGVSSGTLIRALKLLFLVGCCGQQFIHNSFI